MYLVYRILLLIVYFGIFIHCQGGSGGGSKGSSGRISSAANSGVSCITDDCRKLAGIIAGSVIGGAIVLILLVVGTIRCRIYWKRRALQKNPDFVNLSYKKDNEDEAYDVNPFQSGYWSSRYFQYSNWHGPYQYSLSFDPQSMKVTGSGSDDIGTFTIDGNYSLETKRIDLTKIYQAGTGNWSENLEHQVTIELTWNPEDHQFVGKWYVHTDQYHGENNFELKFDKQYQIVE